LGSPWGQKALLSLRFKGNLVILPKTRFKKRLEFRKIKCICGQFWGPLLATVASILAQNHQLTDKHKNEKKNNANNVEFAKKRWHPRGSDVGERAFGRILKNEKVLERSRSKLYSVFGVFSDEQRGPTIR
jgi:hypothetical protein